MGPSIYYSSLPLLGGVSTQGEPFPRLISRILLLTERTPCFKLFEFVRIFDRNGLKRRFYTARHNDCMIAGETMMRVVKETRDERLVDK